MLTRQPAACYSSPVRVPVGGGFCAEVPDGEGTVVTRWLASAERILDSLYELRRGGGALECRNALVEDSCRPPHGDSSPWCWDIRVAGHAFPVTCLLTHPKVVEYLRNAVEHLLQDSCVCYVRDQELRVSRSRHATKMPGWEGPFDLSTGYCVELVFD